MVEIAAADQRIAAVIAQSPYMSGVAVLRSAGVAHNLRLSAAAMRDVVAGRRGGARPMAVVGPPGSMAAMTSPDAEPGYLALFPPGYELAEPLPASRDARSCPPTAPTARRGGSRRRCSCR